jgi:hypothetical protein
MIHVPSVSFVLVIAILRKNSILPTIARAGTSPLVFAPGLQAAKPSRATGKRRLRVALMVHAALP